jgi:RHS repeat-associated protein
LFTNNTAAKKFLWGLDLSGSEQGAGGVGGLLKVWDHYTANHCFVGYDGNGNVAVLTMAHSGEAGQARAQFEYGPFGEPIRSSGTTTLAANDHRGMPFRFSTKYTDQESDLVYYGYRYYNPWTGSWPNRDPIEEQGGYNLYSFTGNRPPILLDYLGWFSHSHGCTSEQLDAIRAAEWQSVLQTRKALLRLGDFSREAVAGRHSRFAERVAREWDFRLTYFRWETNLRKTISALDHGFAQNQYGVECECWCFGDKEAYVRDAWVYAGLDDDIHFCPKFFELSSVRQAEAFLHEASHLLAGTWDLLLKGGPPWQENPIDAHWIEDIAWKDPYMFFDDWIVFFTRNFGRMR